MEQGGGEVHRRGALVGCSEELDKLADELLAAKKGENKSEMGYKVGEEVARRLGKSSEERLAWRQENCPEQRLLCKVQRGRPARWML